MCLPDTAPPDLINPCAAAGRNSHRNQERSISEDTSKVLDYGHVPLRTQWVQSLSAKIIDGELFLRSVSTMTNFFANTWLLLRDIDRLNLFVCPHLYTARIGWCIVFGRRMYGIDDILAGSWYWKHRIDKSCIRYLTDYNTIIDWPVYRHRGWIDHGCTIRIASYPNLGSFGSRGDEKYAAFTGSLPYLRRPLRWR